MEETTRIITTSSRITEAEAKKCIAEMNLINGFLFGSQDSIFKLPPENSKKLREMLKYIVSGEIPDDKNDSINAIDSIVSKVKSREEVTKTYMKQFDLEWSVRHETMLNNGIEDIRFDRDENIPREVTRKRLLHRGLNNSDIDDLFAQVDAEEKEGVTN